MNITDLAKPLLTYQDPIVREVIQRLLNEIPTAYEQGYLAGCKFTDAELSIERHMP